MSELYQLCAGFFSSRTFYYSYFYPSRKHIKYHLLWLEDVSKNLNCIDYISQAFQLDASDTADIDESIFVKEAEKDVKIPENHSKYYY